MSILIWLLVLFVGAFIVDLIFQRSPDLAPLRRILWLVVGVLAIIMLIAAFAGGMPGLPFRDLD